MIMRIYIKEKGEPLEHFGMSLTLQIILPSQSNPTYKHPHQSTTHNYQILWVDKNDSFT